jgi:hypothetical protein
MKLHQSFKVNRNTFSTDTDTSDEPKFEPNSDGQISASLHLLAKGFAATYIVDLAGTVFARFSQENCDTVAKAAIFDVREGQLCTDDPILMQDLRIALTRLRRAKTQYYSNSGNRYRCGSKKYTYRYWKLRISLPSPRVSTHRRSSV